MSSPKSAYSIPTKKGKLDTHIFVVWVDNESGVLARVVGLFSGRGYNIESLAVAEVDKKQHVSRITIVTKGTPEVIQQIKLQLGKLIPVHKVADFSRNDTNIIFKELALFKLVGTSAKQKKAMQRLTVLFSYSPKLTESSHEIPGLEGATCDPLENNSSGHGCSTCDPPPKIILSSLGGSTCDPVSK